MKIKDLERTVNIAWSPASHHPILLATGTAAQQLDASFNTNAALEVYSLNLSDPGMDLEMTASTSSDNRFYKIVWGTSNNDTSGFIVGGCDGGIIQIYNASKLLSGNDDCLVSRQEKHTGPVQSLDFNPFQNNLLASGASDSEIYIWDLNNTNTPMTPGAKAQPFEPVQCLSWNRQVQHILATAFSSRCVVWDLRKNEPIIKLTDAASHIRWKYVSWHPEVATQLCLASEEDQTPIIQLWDLRFATSPLKVLDHHNRGVLAVAWCTNDPDLLISCGKDNRILCWNPNSNQPRGEVLAEVAQTLQWNFDVAWCPRNPAIFAAASFDGHASIYSLMGGKQQQVQTSNKIADSFPGMDGYVEAPLPQQAPPISVDLAKAPKWLKRPVGASFAFGGKLITFDDTQSNNERSHSVIVSQVVTEPELIRTANELEHSIQMGDYVAYCRQKGDAAANQHDRYVWHFLKANFEQNYKLELLNLLGFYPDDINNVMNEFIAKKTRDNQDDDDLMKSIDSIGNKTRKLSVTPFKIKTGDDTDGLITQAILVGNIEAAVELCLESNRMADALIIAMTGGADLLARTQHRYLQQSTGYVSALISALVSEDWSTVINECSIDSWKEALAAALTYCPNDELPSLCERLGERLETENNGNKQLLQDAQLCYICAGSFNKLVGSWSSDLAIQNSPKKLQELVELVTFMQKAIEQQGRTVDVSGNLAELLSHYAILLASQGNLNNALNYLGPSSDANLNELRERLYCNLGLKQTVQQQQQQQTSYSNRRASATQRTSFSSSNQFAPTSPIINHPQPVPFQPQPQKFNTGLPTPPAAAAAAASIVQQSWNPIAPQQQQQQQPMVVPPLMNQQQQPPRPTSATGTSRNKYIVDPSVQSSYNQMRPIQTQPSQMVSSVNQQPLPPSLPPLPPPGNMEMAHQTQTNPGWNDPPVVTKTIRPQPKTEMAQPSPITHPLFGVAQASPDANQMNNGYGEVNQQCAMPPLPSYGQQQYQQQQQQQFPMPTQQQRQAPPTPQPPVAQEAQPKAPVPEEHMYLQTVFNELQAQCSCAANNPQTKRKLDDVARKLETLYDMLRGHKLSPQTLSGLHQMVQTVQIGDYTNGLALHTQLVSGPDFAQIASFMPGLKVLLQCALQLQVYLR